MPQATVKRVQLRTLKAHPLNAQIYRPGEVDDLAASISRHGQLEPLVLDQNRTILSGHRRVQAMRQLGWSMGLARIERHADDVVALIEFNRTRTRTWSERYRELAALLPRLTEEAASRRTAGARAGAAARHGLPVTNVGSRHGRSRVFDEISQLTGIRRETARKLVRVFEAIDAGSISPRVGERLDDGEISVHKAYQTVIRLRSDRPHASAAPTTTGGHLPFDIWEFGKRSRRYERPGEDPEAAAPPQAWESLIGSHTNLGDLVVDPMAGTGTVARVAEAMGRRGLAFDLTPRGEGVVRHDLLSGFPTVPRSPTMIILDPPYGRSRQYSRRRADLSTCRDLDGFFDRLGVCVEHCLAAMDEGSTLAVVMGNMSIAGVTHDLAWQTGELLRRRGLEFRRIWLPFSRQTHPGHRVQRARREGSLLTLQREIFVIAAKNQKGVSQTARLVAEAGM